MFMTRAAKIIASGLSTLFLLVCLTFFLSQWVPIDPTLSVVADSASSESYRQARNQLGLDAPFVSKLSSYFKKLLSGDLGTSIMTSNPVRADLKRVFSATVELACIAMTMALVGGVLLGILAAKNPRSFWDVLVELQVVIYSIPVFVLSIVFLLIFYVILHWTPGPGRVDIMYSNYDTHSGFLLFESLYNKDWNVFCSALHHIILPATILGLFTMTTFSRMTRSFITEELSKPYVLTATLKGLTSKKILFKHVLRNVYVPVFTVIVMSFTSLLEGAVITETIFAWPGIGSYLTQSLMAMDHHAFLGATLLIGLVVVTCNVAIDVLTPILDPRYKQCI